MVFISSLLGLNLQLARVKGDYVPFILIFLLFFAFGLENFVHMYANTALTVKKDPPWTA